MLPSLVWNEIDKFNYKSNRLTLSYQIYQALIREWIKVLAVFLILPGINLDIQIHNLNRFAIIVRQIAKVYLNSIIDD